VPQLAQLALGLHPLMDELLFILSLSNYSILIVDVRQHLTNYRWTGRSPVYIFNHNKNYNMNNNYVISYKTADNEFGMITVTGEDHIDAEASFYMVADENNWAIEEVMSVSAVLEFTDDVYEMEDHDNWLDQYVKVHY
jgi:hypothetical protein